MALISLLIFCDRYLYIILFERYLFPLNLDDVDYTSKPKQEKFTKKNDFQNFRLITVSSFHFFNLLLVSENLSKS